MFDPTIYDNLKVVFEGAVYDMDLSGAVQITGRTDRVELSSMSRSFGMELVRVQDGRTRCSFLLAASVDDLSAELLSDTKRQPGCSLELTFVFPIHDMEHDCAAAAQLMAEIWGEEHRVEQCVITVYGQQPVQLTSKITVKFHKKLDERHIDDISSLLDHLVLSMKHLDERIVKSGR
jgi:hypothetical protein